MEFNLGDKLMSSYHPQWTYMLDAFLFIYWDLSYLKELNRVRPGRHFGRRQWPVTFSSYQENNRYVHKVSSSQVQLSEPELLFINLLFIKYKIYFSTDQNIWWRVKGHMKTVWETKRSLQKSPELCLFVVYHYIVSQIFRLDLTLLFIYRVLRKNLG